MKLKRSIIILGLIALTLLSACGSGNSSKSSNDSVTIQYWHTLTEEERVSHLEELIEQFQEENPGITVQQVSVPEENFPSKVTAALSAGRLPAMLEGGIDQVLFLGNQKVTNNDVHKAIVEEVGKDDYFEGALNTMKVAGSESYYGVPLHGWVQGIWYNDALFKEKGLEPPTTWETVLKAAKEFHAPDQQMYGIVTGTAKDDFTEQTFSQFALSNNAYVFNDKHEVTFNTPEMIETLNFYKELAQYSPPGAESWREARENYLSGRTPMIMYSTFIMNDLATSPDLVKNTKFVVPNNKTKATYGQITSVAITNTVSDQESEAAKKFTLFLMKKENNINYLHMSPGGMNPTRSSITEDPAYLENEVLKTYGDVAVDIASSLKDLKRFGFEHGVIEPAMGDISAQFIIGEAINSITERNVDVEKAAAEAQKAMEKIAEDLQ